MREWIGTGMLVALSAAACAGGAPNGSTAVRGPGPVLDPVAVAFASPSDGVAVGGGTIATTTDGGRTWTVRRSGRRRLGAVTIAADGTAMVTVGRCSETCTTTGGLLASTDGGRTWSVRTRAPVYRPSFAAATLGWALPARARAGAGSHAPATADGGGRRFRILAPRRRRRLPLRTRDAGRSWRTLATVALAGAPPAGVPAHSLPSAGVMPGMTMLPSGRGWLWGDRGRLVATGDGVSWHVVTRAFRPDVDVVRSVDFVDARTGYALVWRGGVTRLMRTGEGGRTWSAVHAWRPLL